MSSFTITTPETSVNLRPSSVKPGGKAKGTATYTVMNTSGSTRKVKLSIEPGPGADRSWFTVRDGESRELAPGATTTFSVDLEVPGGSANHSFKGIAVNERDTDNDFEVGSTIAFDAPAIGKNGGVKWWMIAAPIALLLVVGGVIALFINGEEPEPEPEGVTLANFVDSPLEEAKAALEAQGITVVEKTTSTSAPEFDRQKFYDRIVVQQTPASDGALEVPQGTSVELGWQWSPKIVTVPTLTNKPFGQAVSEIEKVGLRYVGLIGPHGNQPSAKHYAAVQSWNPVGQQEAGTGVTLTMTWVQAPDRFTAEQLEQFHNVFIQKKDSITPAWRGRPLERTP